ncbi:tetratricopeptide repeat protein [Thalassoglobus sp. JC818]|uniref:tetratricopeptide repeat protein n=1 Tax=Thalassoglobus sp. JC818 TaxID=3232136 RepID=UPI00345778FC
MTATVQHEQPAAEVPSSSNFEVKAFDPEEVARCLKEGRPLKELVDFDDRVWETMYDFGFRNFQNGQFSAAEYWWTQCCLFESHRDRNWIALGVACKKQNKFSEALNAFSLAAHNGSKNPWAPLHAAECLIQLAEFDKAALALNDAEEWLNSSKDPSQLQSRITMLRRGLERRKQREDNHSPPRE